MSGETDLGKLLSSMSPALSDEDFVFVGSKKSIEELASLEPWAIITEEEGPTLIVTKERADKNRLTYEAVFSRITLNVHSSLEAVGLTARVAAKLAQRGISANVVAGYYHDHIFVQRDKARSAMAALEELARENAI
jgi:uncharacterized protein